MYFTISRGETLCYASTSLVAESCPNCGCWHAIPKDLYDMARADSSRFIYCPNGHRWHFCKSTKEELGEQRERARRAEAKNVHLQDQLGEAERSKRALKGVVTRTKNRIGKGVCPCCNRYFEKLARHIKTKHPTYT